MLLGANTAVPESYAPEILDPIPRTQGRSALGLDGQSQPFFGDDVWHGWELSWLGDEGVTQTGVLRLTVPSSSPMLVESKSLKLYLNSLNQTRCGDVQSLQNRLREDIGEVVKDEVGVEVLDLQDTSLLPGAIPGDCIDSLVPGAIPSVPDARSLNAQSGPGEQVLHSNVLRSLCPVTGQPDWATLIVRVKGVQLDESSLLRYVLAFRQHQEFHEQCVERIYCDLLRCCLPEYLSVQALYTRRGGLDINPFRSSVSETAPRLRSLRQ